MVGWWELVSVFMKVQWWKNGWWWVYTFFLEVQPPLYRSVSEPPLIFVGIYHHPKRNLAIFFWVATTSRVENSHGTSSFRDDFCTPHYLIRKRTNPTNLFVQNACDISAEPCVFQKNIAGWWHEVVPDQVRWNSPELREVFSHEATNERRALEPDAAPNGGRLGGPRMQQKKTSSNCGCLLGRDLGRLCATQWPSQTFAEGAIFDEIVSNCEEKVF